MKCTRDKNVGFEKENYVKKIPTYKKYNSKNSDSKIENLGYDNLRITMP